MANNPQSRKWHITVNNPSEKGFSHERIKSEFQKMKSIIYYCMADEIGLGEHTPHIHIFIACSAPVRFSTLQKRFESIAHLEAARDTAQSNRDYVAKEGKWLKDEKRGTIVPDSFEEWGEMPDEQRAIGGLEAEIINRIQDGATNADILYEYPKCLHKLRDIDYARQTLQIAEYGNDWREKKVTYIYGSTEVGKTRYVMDTYGYSNVYRVTDYEHPFDLYSGQSVLVFDEFYSGIRISDLLVYLDGYPLAFPARFSPKVACHTIVYIISNVELLEQYPHIQNTQPEIWKALLRRINHVIHFTKSGVRKEYTTDEYINGFVEMDDDNDPFTTAEKGGEPEQLTIE